MIDLTSRQKCFYWQTDRNLSPEDYKQIFLQRHELSTKVIINVLKKGITSIPKIKSIKVLSPDENVVKGNVNIVRKILLNKKEYIVRMHPRGVKNGYFYVEKEALVAAKNQGVSVPQILEIHEARDENDMDFILMSVSSGINMDVFLQKDKTKEDVLLFNCGKQMAKIHNIKVERFGFFNNQIAKSKGQLLGLHKKYNDFIHVGLSENLERLVKYKIINKKQANNIDRVFKIYSFEPLEGSRLIHNDFADWNLLTDKKQITAVLDWDECHAGDPVADLACWSTFFNIERMKKFLEGYTSIAKLPEDYDSRFHFYRLRYTISKMALRIKRYQVDRSSFILEKLKIGKKALKEETKWFKNRVNVLY